MLIVDRFGEVQAYADVGERQILYPMSTTSEGKRRGGAPLCCPVFGLPPESGAWSKTRLPQHGLVRLLPEERPELQPTYRQVCGLSRYQLSFPSDDRFPWQHSVEIALTEGILFGGDNVNELIHRVAITNEELDHENGRMPLSFGWHPYFATHGQPFTVKLGSKTIATEETDLTRSLHEMQMLGLTLETVYGFAEITTSGYDQWVIWSDDSTKYVCLEPVAGYQSGYRLSSLETISAMAAVRYTPKP